MPSVNNLGLSPAMWKARLAPFFLSQCQLICAQVDVLTGSALVEFQRLSRDDSGSPMGRPISLPVIDVGLDEDLLKPVFAAHGLYIGNYDLISLHHDPRSGFNEARFTKHEAAPGHNPRQVVLTLKISSVPDSDPEILYRAH